jgi:hypothetical protein
VTQAGHRIFSYGTLRDPTVQQALYGRHVAEEIDGLTGFARSLIPISNEEVVRVSGATHHPVLRASGDPADRIAGATLLLDDDELRITDDYEGADYRRIAVTLDSGRTAFVYVGKDDS